ncbi:MAG: tetratricopeptide repeat protein, partial [Marinicellaceae bacterium]
KTSSFAVKKAIELDPNYASSYATLARIQSQQRNFIEADNTMKKALALDYTHSYINAVAASNAMFSGNLALALSYREKVKDIDPKYFHNYYGIGLIHFFDNNMDKALKAFQEYEKYNPNKDALNYMISAVLLNQGQTELAYEYAQKETDDFWKNYAMNLVLIAQNKQIEADKLLMAFINRYQNSDLANIARIYAFRGEIDKSFEWLEKAFNHPDSTLIHVLNFPDFRKMHFDTRWHDLIRKMKFPDNHWLVKKLPQS